MSNREIEDFIKNMYGTEVSPSLISRISDRILPEIREWQNRPLKRLYAMVFMDAIHYHVIANQRMIYFEERIVNDDLIV